MVLILFFSGISFAQLRHELKLDVIGLLYKDYSLFDEILIKDHQGFSTRLNYHTNHISYNNVFTFFQEASSRIHILRADFVYKFYFSKKRQNAGFYLGPQLGFEFLLKEDDDLDELNIQYRGKPYDYDNRELLGIGLAGGYKYVLKEHWVFEIMLQSEFQPLFMLQGENRLFAFSTFGLLKAGYRF
jgi:hypothetical protein